MTAPPKQDKPRWPRAEALHVAEEICEALRTVTLKREIAGSLRRGKAVVGDIEILYIPRWSVAPLDFFSDLQDLAESAIATLVEEGVLAARKNSVGRVAWGQKNKLAVHVRSGIPVDLFAASEENWWNYLVCRTGPAALNTRICVAAQRKRWKWNPYGAGFSRGNEIVVMESEADVFEFVGLPYLKPEERK